MEQGKEHSAELVEQSDELVEQGEEHATELVEQGKELVEQDDEHAIQLVEQGVCYRTGRTRFMLQNW